jgi:hypothetical protein
MCTFERYEPQAPCPYCFESSGFGYRIVSGGWSDPDYAEPDPNDPCPHCNGTGSVDAVEAGPPEEWDDKGFDGDGYLAALDRQASLVSLNSGTA